MKTINVITPTGMTLMIYEEIADYMNLSQGEQIKTEDRFWEILRKNCEFGILMCKIQLTREAE